MDQPVVLARVDERSAHYLELDALRGIAAFVVLIHHSLLFTPDFGDFFYTKGAASAHGLVEAAFFYTPLVLLWQGRSAVMLFFVLSGFVLSLPWWRGRPQSYPVFLVRRVTRIYLPYLAAVCGATALMLLAGGGAIPEMGGWFNLSWEDPLTGLVAWQNLAMTGSGTFIDNPVWSAIWEMRISAIFPAVMAAALILGDAGLLASLVVLTAIYGSAHLLHLPEFWITITSQMLAFTMLFVLGALCARRIGTIMRAGARGPKWLSTAMLCAGLLLLCPLWSTKTLVEVVPLGIGSALVICAVMLPGRVNAALHRPLPLWLGRVSFSLYLIHVPILLATVRLTYGAVPVPVALVLGAGLSLVLAEGFHRAVEQPCQQLGRRLTAGRARKTILAVP